MREHQVWAERQQGLKLRPDMFGRETGACLVKVRRIDQTGLQALLGSGHAQSQLDIEGTSIDGQRVHPARWRRPAQAAPPASHKRCGRATRC